MGYRLTKIYTKTGDNGTTGLGDGSRIAKDALRINAMGEVDELNSFIGVLRAHLMLVGNLDYQLLLDKHLSRIQHMLFNIGGVLCMPTCFAKTAINQQHIEQLEIALDNMNAHLPPLKDFILPAGSVLVASTHHARTVCRRVERVLVALSQQEQISGYILMYINRLSDWLFVLARYIAQQQGNADVLWQKEIEQ